MCLVFLFYAKSWLGRGSSAIRSVFPPRLLCEDAALKECPVLLKTRASLSMSPYFTWIVFISKRCWANASVSPLPWDVLLDNLWNESLESTWQWVNNSGAVWRWVGDKMAGGSLLGWSQTGMRA